MTNNTLYKKLVTGFMKAGCAPEEAAGRALQAVRNKDRMVELKNKTIKPITIKPELINGMFVDFGNNGMLLVAEKY